MNSNVLYADKIVPQVKYGGSGDGQMILLTGLLPISNGAACIKYGHNTYPCYAKMFEESYTINPCPNAYNQKEINVSYGINELINSPRTIDNDKWVFNILDSIVDAHCGNNITPMFVLAITVSTHPPFDMAESIDYALPSDMPINMRKYLQCTHYMDECLGTFIHKLEQCGMFQNSDIVITGDHTTFHTMQRQQICSYLNNQTELINDSASYCPLIIYSPTFEVSKYSHNLFYQVDLYPTILNELGLNDYWWQGFGTNIFKDEERPISLSNAFVLSDKIIMGNYFAN